jgi:hypothetical protein
MPSYFRQAQERSGEQKAGKFHHAASGLLVGRVRSHSIKSDKRQYRYF